MEPIFSESYIDPIFQPASPTGYVKRDMQAHPVGAFAPPANIPLVDLAALPGIIREQEEKKSRLSDVLRRQGIPSLNQNDPNRPRKWGYCWCYGTVGAVVALRALNGEPYVNLTGFPNAFTMMNGADQGAWGGKSLEHIGKYGIPPDSHWPEFDTKMRPMSDPCWTEALKYKVTDGFMEMADPEYDRDFSKHQTLSLLAARVPVVADMDDWGHCTYWCDVVDCYPNRSATDLSRYGIRGRNSWGDSWGDIGFYIRKDRYSTPDNAVAPLIVPAW